MTQLSEHSKQMKQDIRKDYLEGMSLAEIAKKYHFKHTRNVYWHLKGLTIEEKVIHLQKRLEKKNE